MDKNRVVEYEGEDIWGETFILTSWPHQKRYEGYPLDSISIDIKSNQYYIDMEDDEFSTEKGFRSFFQETIEALEKGRKKGK